jgi:hypothetical protein
MSVQHECDERISGHSGQRNRRHRRLRHLVVIAAASTVLAACADDDGASSEPTDAPGGSSVSAELDVHYRHAAAGVDQTYTIICTQSSAALSGAAVEVDAEAACDALGQSAVVERLTQGPPADQVCTEIYGGDDTAEIEGTVGDQPIETVVDRSNGCGIDTWDGLLAPILPPALGVVDPTATTG